MVTECFLVDILPLILGGCKPVLCLNQQDFPSQAGLSLKELRTFSFGLLLWWVWLVIKALEDSAQAALRQGSARELHVYFDHIF